jgi:hypothetical protein
MSSSDKDDFSYGQTVNVFGELVKPLYRSDKVFYIPIKRPTKFNTDNMQRKAAMFSSAKQDWQTPLTFYNKLCQERGLCEGYDTDPATAEDNPLGCKFFYTINDDGLTKPWTGNVFINPPFGWGYYQGKWTYITGLWIESAWKKIFESKDPITLITMIVPASVSTKVFHKYLWNYKEATARPNVRVNFREGRERFRGSKMVAPFSTMIVDFYKKL